MIVTRGLGRPARGAIVAFGLGLAVAGGLPVDVTLLATRDSHTVSVVTSTQQATADTQTFLIVDTLTRDTVDADTAGAVSASTTATVRYVTVTMATVNSSAISDLETQT